jgi:octopine/nopaline transport system permease protein
VQIFLFYYGLGQFDSSATMRLWWVISDAPAAPFWRLALNTAAYTSEILRGGLMSVPVGLIEAAKACGMSRILRFRRIEFPLAIRQALPAYGNELVLTVKGTSLASTITVLEDHRLRQAADEPDLCDLRSVCRLPVLIYLVTNLVLITLVRALEHKLTRHQMR